MKEKILNSDGLFSLKQQADIILRKNKLDYSLNDRSYLLYFYLEYWDVQQWIHYIWEFFSNFKKEYLQSTPDEIFSLSQNIDIYLWLSKFSLPDEYEEKLKLLKEKVDSAIKGRYEGSIGYVDYLEYNKFPYTLAVNNLLKKVVNTVNFWENQIPYYILSFTKLLINFDISEAMKLISKYDNFPRKSLTATFLRDLLILKIYFTNKQKITSLFVSQELKSLLVWDSQEFIKLILNKYKKYENKLYYLQLIIFLFQNYKNSSFKESLLFDFVFALSSVFGYKKFENVFFDNFLKEWFLWTDKNLVKGVLRNTFENKIKNFFLVNVDSWNISKQISFMDKFLDTFFPGSRFLILKNNNLLANNWFFQSEVELFQKKRKDLSYDWWHLNYEWFDTLIWKAFLDDDKVYVFVDKWTKAITKFSYADMWLIDKLFEKVFFKNTEDLVDILMWYLSKFKDPETSDHMNRVWKYVEDILTDSELFWEKYEKILSSIENVFKNYNLEFTRESLVEKISTLSKWHDIGKIEIPDKVLMKNWPFNEEERQIMNLHPILGSAYSLNKLWILQALDERVLDIISLTHHLVLRQYPFNINTWQLNVDITYVKQSGIDEILFQDYLNFDVKRFQDKFADKDFRKGIFYLSFVVWLADAFDALISKRHYKNSFSFEKVKNILTEDLQKFIEKIEDESIKKDFVEIKTKLDIILDKLYLVYNSYKNDS